MEITSTKFKDLYQISPQVFKDTRGFFLEWYSEKTFQSLGINTTFVQDNHALSIKTGVLRGLHFQIPPYAQAKLIRVTKGAVWDVVVDLRKESETYGLWQEFELTEENFRMLYIPKGFAHGYCTLKPNTEFFYKTDDFYTPDYEGSLLWNDPDLNIAWPISDPILSEKDQQSPYFKGFNSPF